MSHMQLYSQQGFITVKGHETKVAKRKAYGYVWRKAGASFQEASQGGGVAQDVLSSSSNRSCDNMCEMLPAREAH